MMRRGLPIPCTETFIHPLLSIHCILPLHRIVSFLSLFLSLLSLFNLLAPADGLRCSALVALLETALAGDCAALVSVRTLTVARVDAWRAAWYTHAH